MAWKKEIFHGAEMSSVNKVIDVRESANGRAIILSAIVCHGTCNSSTEAYLDRQQVIELSGILDEWLAGQQPATDVQSPNLKHGGLRTWTCKIGGRGLTVPDGGDAPLRRAVEQAFERLFGRPSEFNFTGWGSVLSTIEYEVAYAPKSRQDDGTLPWPDSRGWWVFQINGQNTVVLALAVVDDAEIAIHTQLASDAEQRRYTISTMPFAIRCSKLPFSSVLPEYVEPLTKA